MMARWLDRRVGALAIVAALLALALVLVVDAAAAIWSEARALDLLRERTELMEERAASITRDDSGPDGRTTVDNWLINGDTAGLASAELQRTLADIAERNGARLHSVDMGESEPVEEATGVAGDRLVRLRLEADLEVPEQALADLLHAIETSLPIMVVDSVTLRPIRSVGQAFETALNMTADRTLNLRLAVSSFWLEEPSR